MALPLEVRLLQPGKGLGADEGRVAEGHGKKRNRKRGGTKTRQKRHADRTRAAKEARDQREHEAEMATGEARSPASEQKDKCVAASSCRPMPPPYGTAASSPPRPAASSGTPGIFSFINTALGDASEAAAVVRQGGAAYDGTQRGSEPPFRLMAELEEARAR